MDTVGVQMTQPFETAPVKIYASGWKPVAAWKQQSAGGEVSFLFRHPVSEMGAELLGNSAVRVFARNLWSGEPESDGMDMPMELPFNFLPFNDQPGYTEQWNYSIKEQNIELSVQVAGTKRILPPNSKLEICFLIIPEQVLAAKGKTKTAVQQMTYEELVQLFGIPA